MAKKHPDIESYSAILVIEKDSKWIHAQIGPFDSKADADQYAQKLASIFTTDKPCPVAANTVHQEGKELEKSEVHSWH